MADDTDFAMLYRELGVDPGCSPAELRHAWRRRVAKLHPDLGGNAEDTGRLQQLNRLYDAAVDFHTRYGRMPGAPPPGFLGATADAAPRTHSWRRADLDQGRLDRRAMNQHGSGERSPDERGPNKDRPSEKTGHPQRFSGTGLEDHETDPAGFGRIPRYFIVVSLLAILVLAWRIAYRTDDIETDDGYASNAGSAIEGEFPADGMAKAEPIAQAIMPGMSKNTVRDILGDPLDMHALRWSYGPSWVEFSCDRVVRWYSSPLRPLPVADARAEAPQPVDDRCD